MTEEEPKIITLPDSRMAITRHVVRIVELANGTQFEVAHETARPLIEGEQPKEGEKEVIFNPILLVSGERSFLI